MRGNSSTNGSNTHSITGNVTINGSGVYMSGVNNTGATTGVATWNIGGNVTLTGGSRIVLFESAGPHTGSSTFNINGNLEIGTGCYVQLRSSTTANASTGIGTLNVKGNITNYGQISTSAGTTSAAGMVINVNGTNAQTWTGSFPKVFSTPQTCTINIDNNAGVSLVKSDSLNTLSTLSFVNGVLKLGDNNLLISGGQIANYSSTKFIVTNGTGKLIQSATAATPKLFPIGASASSYDPVTVTPTSASDFTVGVSSSLSGSPVYGVRYNAKEWSIASSSPSSTVVALTPSSVVESSDPIIGLYSSGAYSNSAATLSGSTFSTTTNTFGSFVTGSNILTTDIAAISSKSIISTSHNQITIQNTKAGDTVAVYTINGQLVKKLTVAGIQSSYTFPSGIYLVKVNNTTTKIVL